MLCSKCGQPPKNPEEKDFVYDFGWCFSCEKIEQENYENLEDIDDDSFSTHIS